jgi:hypothetical protein
MLFDVRSRVIYQMHVVHIRGTRGHAGKTGEAAVNVLDFRGGWPALVLQHVLHQIDAATRAVELVPQEQIGRAGRQTESAVHALANYRFGAGSSRILELPCRELRLHTSIQKPCGLKYTGRIKGPAHARLEGTDR